MSKETRLPIKKSIATKILLVVLGFYLLIGTVTTLGQVWMDYRYQKVNIIQDLKDLEDSFKNGLAVNLWGLDQEALEASIDGMLKIPTLVGAEILTDTGITIAIGGIVTHNGKTGNVGLHVNLSGISDYQKTVHKAEPYKFEIFTHRFPITYARKGKITQLGVATIYSNSSVIYRRMKLQVILLAINIILTMGTFFIALLWTVNRYLRRPLASLTSATGRVSLESLDSFRVNIGISDQNELKALEESFNSMIGNLHHSMEKREKTEEKLRTVNMELNSKNKELEQILYVASHDLRSPLVNVQGFSKELMNDFQDVLLNLKEEDLPDSLIKRLEPILKEDIPLALGFIGKGVDKMDSLLAGLLKISRLGRAAIKRNPLDMNKLVTEAVTNLEFQISQKGVNVQIQDLPGCCGDELQTGQVFSNLIGNAVKFTESENRGIIKITGEREGESVIYCVEDNGIGIEKAHQGKIFEIFHKLNPEIEGQGLGLNIVKIIIERQGGEIWVDSEPGRVCSFFL
jgi:signal transduction histidine kinase